MIIMLGSYKNTSTARRSVKTIDSGLVQSSVAPQMYKY